MSFLTRALCFPSRVPGKPATRLGLQGPAQPYEPNWSQPKNFFIKNSSKIIKKICDFPQFCYCILINIGLYFYTVKIQIWY
jgi:hypothetical protein